MQTSLACNHPVLSALVASRCQFVFWQTFLDHFAPLQLVQLFVDIIFSLVCSFTRDLRPCLFSPLLPCLDEICSFLSLVWRGGTISDVTETHPVSGSNSLIWFCYICRPKVVFQQPSRYSEPCAVRCRQRSVF